MKDTEIKKDNCIVSKLVCDVGIFYLKAIVDKYCDCYYSSGYNLTDTDYCIVM